MQRLVKLNSILLSKFEGSSIAFWENHGNNIITSSTHPLHILLPPKVQKHYSTRPRGHCYQLPRKTTALDESNFFYRLLYRDILSFTFAD